MTPPAALVLTTLPTGGNAEAFARALVEERLAACVNVLPEMRSIYRWEGRIEEEQEHQVIIKTTQARVPALQERIRELHPYDLPELIVLSVHDGSDAYLRWLGESTE